MITQQDYALLSLYVYSPGIQTNRPLLVGWTPEEYVQGDNTGFSYGVFRKNDTGQVVVAFTGTNELLKDSANANICSGPPAVNGHP